MKPDDAITTEASAYPLLVYVHVPKTAGSTIKKILGLSSPRGNAYVEQIIYNSAAFLELAQ